jgi:hypothetical protein
MQKMDPAAQSFHFGVRRDDLLHMWALVSDKAFRAPKANEASDLDEQGELRELSEADPPALVDAGRKELHHRKMLLTISNQDARRER